MIMAAIFSSGAIPDAAGSADADTQLQEEAVKLPIIMYHSILKSRSGDFIVSPAQLEEDLKYIQKKGFSAVTVRDLVNYVYHDIPLPPKPIMITFDDGHLNNATYALALLNQYEMKAVISVVGSYTEISAASNEHSPSYSYLNWDDIKTLMASGIIEIQNHSYDLHKNRGRRHGANKIKGESLEDYYRVLGEDIQKFNEAIENNTGYHPCAFTYPFGFYCKDSETFLRENGFLASLICREKLNRISKDPNCLYKLGRYNRVAGISTYGFFKKVLKDYGDI